MDQVALAKQRFGGTRKLARAAGIPVSTVDSWREFIPAHQQIKIIDAAERLNVPLTMADLVEAGRHALASRESAA